MQTPGSDLARTRRMPVPHRADRRPVALPPGARMLQGERRDLEAYMARSGARAVGRYNTDATGVTTVPVVYVSRRAHPWYVRHRMALVWTGTPLTILAGLYGLVLWVGWAWFIGGVVAAGLFLAFVIRIANGHGLGRRSGGNVNVNVSVSVKR